MKKDFSTVPIFSITPFLKNGRIDYQTLFRNLKYYYSNNVRIFI